MGRVFQLLGLVIVVLVVLAAWGGPPCIEMFHGGTYVLKEFDDVLTAEECQTLIRASEGKAARSTVLGEKDTVSSVRTSETAWMTEENAGEAWPVVQKLRRAAMEATGVRDISKYEDLQLVKYRPTQEYKAHFDSQVVMNPGLEKIHRYATFIVYLNDGFVGGETGFPKLNIRVKPKTGKGALFFNLDSKGEEHPMSLHESVPVKEGIKYACQQWIRM